MTSIGKLSVNSPSVGTPDGLRIADLGEAEAVQDALKAFDVDGDGTIDAQELVRAAELYQNSKKTNSLLRKGIIGLTFGFIALAGVVGGLTYGIVETSKDTVIEGRALVTKSHESVSTNTNEVAVPLGALAFLPGEVASKVKEISFTSEDGETAYHGAVIGIEVSPSSRVAVKTATEDTMEWTGGDSFTVTLKDGTSWTLGANCGVCSAVNVFATEEILEGLEDYGFISESDGRRLSRCHQGDSGPLDW
jgi:hypothetical protein